MMHKLKNIATGIADRTVGWRKIKDTKTRKQWVKGDTIVQVEIASFGAQAVYYNRHRDRRERVRKVLTNGSATVDEAVWVAKLYMDHSITIPACPLKVECEDGLKFQRVDIGTIKSFAENSDKNTGEAVKEFIELAGQGHTKEISKVVTNDKLNN